MTTFKIKFSPPTRSPKAIQLHERTILGLSYGKDKKGLGFIEVSGLKYRGHDIDYPSGKRRGLPLNELHAELIKIVDLCRAAIGKPTTSEFEVEIATVCNNCENHITANMTHDEIVSLGNAGPYAVQLVMTALVDQALLKDELLFNLIAHRLHKSLSTAAALKKGVAA